MFLTTESGHHATIPLHVTRFMQPCRTPFCPVALTTEPETPLPDIPPFQPPDTIKSVNTQLEPIPLPVTTNNICAMTQPDDTPPIILCSAIEFWRHAKAADSTTYVCIFKQQDDTPQPQNRDDFAEYVREYALRHFPQLFPDELPRQLPPSDRIQHPIDLTVGHKILHESFIVNPQTNLPKRNDKFTNIFKLDIFDHQIALLALQCYS